MTISPREEMACALCLSPLNLLDSQYVHPLGRDVVDHRPLPVATSSLDTVDRACDFCSDPHPMWALQGKNISALAAGNRSQLLQNFGQTWAACVPCMADIDTGRPENIVDRAVLRIGAADIASVRYSVGALHRIFLQHRRPGRTLITTTAWPALAVTARDLPRVRDRLAALYRGPDELPTGILARPQRRQTADSLDRARLYFVDESFTDLAEHAAAHLPAVAAQPGLPPADGGLILWARPTASSAVVAASWSTHGGHLDIVLYRAIGGGLDDQPLQRLREEIGWLVPLRTSQQPISELNRPPHPGGRMLLATWLLIAQKAAETAPVDLDTAVRHRYARTGRRLPDVLIVRVRAATRQNGNPNAPSADTGRRAYTSRVWVTGHWRNQAYGPGRTQRRLVYIHPFLRGPADTPIKLTSTVRILRNDDPDLPHRYPES